MNEKVTKLEVVQGSGEANIRRQPQYFCTRCDGDVFRAYSDGRMTCAGVKCGALMRNIEVGERE